MFAACVPVPVRVSCCLQRMLLEAAVYGAVLFGVEQKLEQQYSYKLSTRKDREEQAGQPPM